MKDNKIFRCYCGHYGIIEVTNFKDGDFFISFIEEPKGLKQRFESFFKSRRCISEVALTKNDLVDLTKFLQEQLKKTK